MEKLQIIGKQYISRGGEEEWLGLRRGHLPLLHPLALHPFFVSSSPHYLLLSIRIIHHPSSLPPLHLTFHSLQPSTPPPFYPPTLYLLTLIFPNPLLLQTSSPPAPSSSNLYASPSSNSLPLQTISPSPSSPSSFPHPSTNPARYKSLPGPLGYKWIVQLHIVYQIWRLLLTYASHHKPKCIFLGKLMN